MTCPNCKTIDIPNDARFCPNCGTELRNNASNDLNHETDLSCFESITLPNGETIRLGKTIISHFLGESFYYSKSDTFGEIKFNTGYILHIQSYPRIKDEGYMMASSLTTKYTAMCIGKGAKITNYRFSRLADVPQAWQSLGIGQTEIASISNFLNAGFSDVRTWVDEDKDVNICLCHKLFVVVWAFKRGCAPHHIAVYDNSDYNYSDYLRTGTSIINRG